MMPNPDDPRLLAQFHVTDRQGQPGKWRTLQPDLVSELVWEWILQIWGG
jgi:hypothetical protein